MTTPCSAKEIESARQTNRASSSCDIFGCSFESEKDLGSLKANWLAAGELLDAHQKICAHPDCRK